MRQDSGSGEDDGGVYATTILAFRHVTVDIDSRGYGIERVETADSTLSLAPHIHVGMPLVDVQDALSAPTPIRRIERRLDDLIWMASVCAEGSTVLPSETESIYFYVNNSARITKIALTNYGP